MIIMEHLKNLVRLVFSQAWYFGISYFCLVCQQLIIVANGFRTPAVVVLWGLVTPIFPNNKSIGVGECLFNMESIGRGADDGTKQTRKWWWG